MTPETIKEAGLDLLKKLKADKRAVLLLCAAIVLLLLIGLSELHAAKEDKQEPQQTETVAEVQSDEARLCALLRHIRGAGRAEVMITYSEQAQTVFAAASNSETETDAVNTVRTKEKRDPVVLKSGDRQTGLVERTLLPKVQGIAVVCEGASDPTVRTQIVSAVSALFGLGINHISVAEMASQEEPS